jgi:hypothetical protein
MEEGEMTGILTLLLLTAPQSGDPLRELQRAHIEANVPPPAEFNRLLQRDLEAYFRERRGDASQIRFELLREGPTQSGVAYPKFYVWAQALVGGAVVEQGAVRLAAIERIRFEVTDYLSESSLRAEPGTMQQVFPAAVCDKIRAKLSGTT